MRLDWVEVRQGARLFAENEWNAGLDGRSYRMWQTAFGSYWYATRTSQWPPEYQPLGYNDFGPTRGPFPLRDEAELHMLAQAAARRLGAGKRLVGPK